MIDLRTSRYAVGAIDFLRQRHAARKQIPFTPIAAFDLPLNEMAPGSIGARGCPYGGTD